jgi:hypothetical protein
MSKIADAAARLFMPGRNGALRPARGRAHDGITGSVVGAAARHDERFISEAPNNHLFDFCVDVPQSHS